MPSDPMSSQRFYIYFFRKKIMIQKEIRSTLDVMGFCYRCHGNRMEMDDCTCATRMQTLVHHGWIDGWLYSILPWLL